MKLYTIAVDEDEVFDIMILDSYCTKNNTNVIPYEWVKGLCA